MYQVLIGSKILYAPGSDDFVIYATELNLEVGAAGEFSFKVPASNPLYSSLKMGNIVTIKKDGVEYWRGEIRDIKIDFAKVADVYCLEDLAWLGEEYMAPSLITDETYAQRLMAAINAYNANRGADRQFTVGTVYNGSATCYWATEYEWSILDDIRNCICRDDYFVKVRRVTSGGTVTRYIDVVRLEDYGVAATQPIEYGYNLLDYVKDSDYGNLVNVLTPYGDVEEDASGDPVYLYGDYAKHIQGTTVTNAESVATYGRHAKAVVFDGITDITALNNMAASYLARYSQPQLTMQVSAVDLAEIEAVNPINLGDSVRIIAKPFAVDQRLYLTELTIDLQDIAKNQITLSGNVSRRTLTSQVQSAVNEIPSESDLLTAARKNALNMLLNETQGGYVVYEYDADNKYMTAINICNAQTIDASTKRWRWSQNGFGYLYRDNITDDWNGPTIAMTMDGTLLANIIKTGVLKDLQNKFELNMETGSLTMKDGTFTGTVNATAGYIGSNADWEITSSGIHSQNGPTQATGDNTVGTYVGKDGFCCNASGNKHVWISGGSFSTTGGVYSNGLQISSGGDIILPENGDFLISATGGGTYTGWSGTISWATSGNGYAITVKNGIIVGYSHVTP